ncbi:MAG: ABC transporter substrate-binding protein [Armatimonadota bacterium]|nr:ABC transporter substrate-binding protein [Armatimonadota bacterium]MDR7455028.1 ABC transporter substrate-binding protein [Armatimonadota bacterium]MDR7457635.1 ABC transporter substrate-binding protein [Armatimonadota bacterium]MDR7496534.1 ABC transporter substrate-binding protein [Armatimonadota bacterium]MDR7511328.1 ABC transporter substrate-binding protein [Armatimonadota bacterium]
MNRRTAIILVAALLAATLPAGLQAGPAAGGNVLRLSINGDVTINPLTFPQQLPTTQVIKTMFNTLTKYNPGDLKVVPDLATLWTPAENGRIWIFKLRRNVRWHDGRPFTAADVKFTFDAIMDPRTRALYRTTFTGLQSVAVVDDYTVRFEFDRPYPSLPIVVGFNIPIVPRHLLEGKNLAEMPEFIRNPVGTGPFKWKEYVEGSHLTLEANPDYYAGRPALDALVIKIIPEINTVVAQLRTGELDLGVVEPVHLDSLRGQAHLRFQTVELPSAFYIALNGSRFPFTDRRVRQALMYGLNRPQIVERILKGTANLASGPYAKAFGRFYNPDLKPYPYDVNRAKALLAEAGFRPGAGGVLEREGRPLAFELMVDKGNPTREQIALVAQQQWRQLGAEVRLAVVEWSVYIRRGNQRPGDYDARTSWRITSPDPDKTPEYTSGGTVNHYMYANPEVDRLMAEARATFDPTQRPKLYHRLQQIIYEDVPVIWIFYNSEILAINRRVQNFPNLGLRDALTWMNVVSVAR